MSHSLLSPASKNQSHFFLGSGTLKLLDQFAPFTKKVIPVIKEAPWFDAEYRELRKSRRKAESIRKRSIEDQINYKDLCKKCSDLANIKKKDYFARLINKTNGNPRTLFILVNKELDCKQAHSLPDSNNIFQLVEKFNNFFDEKIMKTNENKIKNVLR